MSKIKDTIENKKHEVNKNLDATYRELSLLKRQLVEQVTLTN